MTIKVKPIIQTLPTSLLFLFLKKVWHASTNHSSSSYSSIPQMFACLIIDIFKLLLRGLIGRSNCSPYCIFFLKISPSWNHQLPMSYPQTIPNSFLILLLLSRPICHVSILLCAYGSPVAIEILCNLSNDHRMSAYHKQLSSETTLNIYIDDIALPI